ncbi:FAD binding domain-containing protein [Antarctobacter jejuensis]|uniref:FAD binding domain-containing protein n=1 Tax=Antarctobacter jejuensis TaxID=1439938 RepID=UPI003FD48221
MIPAGFDYHRPGDLASALALLQTHGEMARVVAGGHSLIPMMKLRLTDLSHLVDLQDIADLKGISVDGTAARIGAMVTQAELIAHEGLTQHLPILRETALQIADPQVRSLGTLGGNVANGDPGNDMPAVMMCLGATYDLVGPEGTRTLEARAFYEGAYDTARAEDEILTRINIPMPVAGSGQAYVKQKRKIGDYATAAAAVIIGQGTASVALTNLADTPVWSAEAGAALAGGDTEGTVAAALAAIDPQKDMKGPVEFKKHVAGVVLRRAIASAQSRRA